MIYKLFYTQHFVSQRFANKLNSVKIMGTMKPKNFADDLNLWLMRATAVSKQELLRAAYKHKLSLAQALTLCVLEPGKTQQMSNMAELLVLDPSTMTGIVEKLSKDGLLKRTESNTDRRAKVIQLTDSGATLRAELLPFIAEQDTPNISRLTAREQQSLKRLLRKTMNGLAVRPVKKKYED